jgi:hypothetical protein
MNLLASNAVPGRDSLTRPESLWDHNVPP